MGDVPMETDWFSKPGDSLIAAMRRRGVKVEELAEKLAGGVDQLRALISGAISIDKDAAATIAGVVGGSPEFWLKRQENYERDLDRAIEAVPAKEAEIWLTTIPAQGPRPRGRMSAEGRKAELRRRIAFFGVGNLVAWQSLYGRERKQTKFRGSTTYSSEDGAVSLWLRQGELDANLVDTTSWNPGALRALLPEMRKLSRISRPARFLPKLKALLAQAGVALVVLRAPSQCKAFGASRLIRPDKAMLLLSFRYRSDDQFWFTVFHELGHLLLHDAQSFVDEEGTPEDECEHQANEFAASIVVPANRLPDFDAITPDREAITRYAVSVGVCPGLVLGQLQHRKRVPQEKLNFLRRHWTWGEIGAALATL